MKPEKKKPKRKKLKVIRHGDWGWYLETKDKSVFEFLGYTFRHQVRLWIGLNGYMGDEWIFKGTKFRGRLHHLLNWIINRLPC